MIRGISGLNRLLTLKRCCILFFSIFLIAPSVSAEDKFWEDRKRGYFWYEDPLLEPPQDQYPALKDQPVNMDPQGDAAPDNYSYEDLFDLHPDRFQVVIDARLKHAVHRPTEENVLRFLEATDVAKKKSRIWPMLQAMWRCKTHV